MNVLVETGQLAGNLFYNEASRKARPLSRDALQIFHRGTVERATYVPVFDLQVDPLDRLSSNTNSVSLVLESCTIHDFLSLLRDSGLETFAVSGNMQIGP